MFDLRKPQKNNDSQIYGCNSINMLLLSSLLLLMPFVAINAKEFSSCTMNTPVKNESVVRNIMSQLFEYSYLKKQEWKGNSGSEYNYVKVNDKQKAIIVKEKERYRYLKITKELLPDILKAFTTDNEKTALSLVVG
ncbi:MAG: hypothetical protein KDC52_15690, partial [Ignavibacteriae bacterium]|nr:hypothetical protein [Ignavibacteriota bacterium]